MIGASATSAASSSEKRTRHLGHNPSQPALGSPAPHLGHVRVKDMIQDALNLVYWILPELRPRITEEYWVNLAASQSNQIAQLVLSFSGRRHCVSDFFANQIAIALAEAVDCDGDRPGVHIELRGNVGIGPIIGGGCEKYLQLIEMGGF